MYAVAISNNDMAYLHWHVEAKIPGCLGFSVIRHDAKTGKSQALPAMVGFPGDKPASKKFKDTNDWPVQKYGWKDLFAPRGGTYWYEIVPMIGTPGHLVPDHDRAMRTNTVTLDAKHGSCSVYFNRGIISTQAIARILAKSKSGRPSPDALREHIEDPDDKLIRPRLMGDLETGVLELLHRAEKEGGQCYCALYELSDKDLVDHLKALKGGNKKEILHIVLSNAGEDTKKGAGDGDSTNQEAREGLHDPKLKIDVTDRILKKGHIGHNKFVVYADKNGPQAVLSGSTNWTASGLCAESNNAILIESPSLAKEYLAYWEQLKKDTKRAGGDRTALQSKKFRDENKKPKGIHGLTDGQKKSGGDVHVWFSPNTTQKSVPRRKNKDGSPGAPPPTPPDLKEVFQLIENAKQGVLFLAFIPGNPSIVSKLKEVYVAKRNAKQLFYLRGAATSPDPASLFRVDLYHRSSKSDASVRAVEQKPSAGVASVAGIYAAFASWEAEIYKIGHAVIHDKILVIDPFTDKSVVVTGSHNLGFRASYCNDENMLIIKNNRPVAEAYAAHVLDVYEHYRWRWMLQRPLSDAFDAAEKKHPDADPAELWRDVMKTVAPAVLKEAWQSLKLSPDWQDFYQDNKGFLAAEINFWSPFSGVAVSAGKPLDPAAGKPRPRRRRPRR